MVADFRPMTEVGAKIEKLQRLDFSWDALWDSAGKLTESGYVVELAIPFKQLRFPRTRGPQTWGFLATREYSRDAFHQLRSGRVDRSKTCFVCQFDAISGLEDMETGLNVEVVPTLTATRADTRASQSAPLTEGDEDTDLGVSARWSISPNVVLGAALNPDFSQVETDTVELAVNERFALQFPEKRPFFLEGADFFETPFEAVFTRTVADPEYGLRLTGKGGPNAYGVMFTEDQLNNLVLPGPERSVQRTLVQDVTGSILRYRRDLGETSALGLLYTGREGTDYENQVLGVDANWRANESNTLRTQILASDTTYPRAFALANRQPTDSFDGTAYLVDWVHSTRDWRWALGAGELASEFRADSGFIPQVGVLETGGFIQRFFWGAPDSWYQRLTVQVDALYQEDAETARVLQHNANIEVFYEGPKESVVRLAFRPNNESLRGRMFTNMRSDLLIADPAARRPGPRALRPRRRDDRHHQRAAGHLPPDPAARRLPARQELLRRRPVQPPGFRGERARPPRRRRRVSEGGDDLERPCATTSRRGCSCARSSSTATSRATSPSTTPGRPCGRRRRASSASSSSPTSSTPAPWSSSATARTSWGTRTSTSAARSRPTSSR